MLVAGFNEPDIGNPVTLPSREASLVPFSIEACRDATKQGLIDTFERVDADHRVGMSVDLTGDDRHNAAADADMELCASGTERVFGSAMAL